MGAYEEEMEKYRRAIAEPEAVLVTVRGRNGHSVVYRILIGEDQSAELTFDRDNGVEMDEKWGDIISIGPTVHTFRLEVRENDPSRLARAYRDAAGVRVR